MLTQSQKAYAAYLNSNHWRDVKVQKRRKVAAKCAYCGDTKNINLHHLFYRPEWKSVKLGDLRWLCRRHHELVHNLSGEIKPSKEKPFRANSFWILAFHAIRRWEKKHTVANQI